MLFDYSTVIASMVGSSDMIVAFRQSSDPCHTALSTKYVTSQSGLVVNGIPGVTSDLLQRAAKSAEYSDVNAYLAEMIPQVCADTLNHFFTRKKALYDIKEVLEHDTANLETVYKDDYSTQSGRAIGYEIRPARSNNIKLQILSISAFARTSGTITFYLYRANAKTAISTKQITLTADNEVWSDVTSWITRYLNGSSGSAQSLFLLVYEHDATNYVAGVQMPSDMSLYQGCGNVKSKYCAIRPVEFPAGALNWTGSAYTLPDLDQIGYTEGSWNGINFRYQCTCDMTQLIIDQKLAFAPLIQKEMAHRLFVDGISSSIFNDVTEAKRLLWKEYVKRLRFELDGAVNETGGAIPGDYTKLDLDLSGIDTICLPCKRRNEVVITHIPTT